eukprot:m.848666 g.848666  ORF g.848666 m.848666 type:complete len:74 (-) comp23489_c0_seq3:35-256(-)
MGWRTWTLQQASPRSQCAYHVAVFVEGNDNACQRSPDALCVPMCNTLRQHCDVLHPSPRQSVCLLCGRTLSIN